MEDREILRFFYDSEDPFQFTGEVADFLGFSNNGARKRLRALERKGLLNSKTGGRVPAWWLADEGTKMLESGSRSLE